MKMIRVIVTHFLAAFLCQRLVLDNLPPGARFKDLAELEPIECVTHGVVSGGGAEHPARGVFVKVRILEVQTLAVHVISGPGRGHIQIAVVSENQKKHCIKL